MRSMSSIDKEFKSLIPPLKPEELAQLEQNILAEGIREPLCVWGDIILDGHNRYAIAQKYNLPFEVTRFDFADRETAKLWIINNQLGRRNLTPQQMAYLIGKRYEMEKSIQGGTGANQYTNNEQTGQNDLSAKLDTADRIANETGVSPKTVKRDAEYARAIDTIAEVAGAVICFYSSQKSIPLICTK